MPSELCEEEIETLKAIFMNDVSFEEDSGDAVKLSMVLFPSTGDDKETKYVTLTLDIVLPSAYPNIIPMLTIRNPRGLSDDAIESLQKRMLNRSNELIGSQMIFELIQMTRDLLTENNKPFSECPICLFGFTDADEFFRTECFHYFHSFCLGKFLKSIDQKEFSDPPGCPVCREKFDNIDADKLIQSSPPMEEYEELDEKMRNVQISQNNGDPKYLQNLYEKQKRQGGIIDLSEKSKQTLIISSPAVPASPQLSSQLQPLTSSTLVTSTTTFVTVGNGHGPANNLLQNKTGSNNTSDRTNTKPNTNNVRKNDNNRTSTTSTTTTTTNTNTTNTTNSNKPANNKESNEPEPDESSAEHRHQNRRHGHGHHNNKSRNRWTK